MKTNDYALKYYLFFFIIIIHLTSPKMLVKHLLEPVEGMEHVHL